MATEGDAAPPRVWGREYSLRPVGSGIVAHGIGIILGLGVVFRVAQALSGRSYWLDEGSLAANIRGLSPAGLFGPLSRSQLAPPGFLVVEWVVGRALGWGPFALRLFPLVCGVGSLFLFLAVARRCLQPPAVALALAVFAASDDLIYYASELKQYSSDVAFGLACTLMGLWLGARELTARRFAACAALGAGVVWFSHPALFVLAGVGLSWFATALAGRRFRRAGALAVLGAVWLGSFAAVFAVAREQLDHGRAMWVFWDFAFAPRPPRSFWDLTWGLRRTIYLFVNPLNFGSVPTPWLTALAPCGLFLAGCVTLGRRSLRTLGVLVLPVLATLLASYLHEYPFHGRLVLFLVPGLVLLIAEGAGAVRSRFGRGLAWWVVLIALLLGPVSSAFLHLAEPRLIREFHPHGDRRSLGLDPVLLRK